MNKVYPTQIMMSNELLYVRGSEFEESKMLMCNFVNQGYQVPLVLVNSSFGTCKLKFN